MKKTSIIFMISFLLLCSGMSCMAEEQTKNVTLSFEGNATTGYCWNGFVLGGDSVELDSMEGTYVPDSNSKNLAGVGGNTYFSIIPVQPGISIIEFTYARSWEPEPIEEKVILAEVDEDMHLTTKDITEEGMLFGTIKSVDQKAASAVLESATTGEVIAYFGDDLSLPVEDEEVCLYTDGVMTMSLPPMVNVFAWKTIPSECAREALESESEE